MSTTAVSTPSATRLVLTWTIAPAVFLTSILILTGVSPLTSLLLTAAVAWQTLGGFLVWRTIRPDSNLLELLGMGLSIGTAIAAIAGLVTSTLQWGPWGSLVPTGVLVLVAARTRTRKTDRHQLSRGEMSAFLMTAVIGLAIVLYSLRRYPLTWTGSWVGYHPDMPFFEALANSLARFGVFESPFMPGTSIHYHWLSYAWTGQLSVMTNAPPFVGITRVLPLVALVGSAAIVVSWTRRLSGSSWTPYLAGALLTTSGFVGAVFGGVLTLDSPSQAMSVLWLLAFTVAVTRAFQGMPRIGLLALLVILSISITLGKVSAAAPAVAAVLLAAIVLVSRRSLGIRQALVIAAATVLPIGLTFLVFLAGSTGGGGLELGSIIDRASSQQGLNPLDGPRGVVLGTAILILAVSPRWMGVAQLVVDPRWRWRPETWISLGLIASSLGALVVFNGFNEIWFSNSVSGPLAAISAVGAGVAVDSLRARGHRTTSTILIAVVTAAAILFAIVWWAWSTGASGGNLFIGTQRWLGPIIAWIGAIALGGALAVWLRSSPLVPAVIAGTVLVLIFVALPGRFLGLGSGQIGVLENGIRNEWFNVSREGRVVSIDQSEVNDWTDSKMEASRVLRDRSKSTDLVVTNITRGPFVAGVTHLPTYVTGMVYQHDYGPKAAQDDLVKREQTVWEFINSPTAENSTFLCTDNVDWLLIDKQRTEQRTWLPFATPIFENDEVIVAMVDRSICPQ